MYLDRYTTIEREHDLLIDMPEQWFRAGLSELNKEHMICNR